jgi:predicted 3-demethylubiquinone-9 3-methyltransferase (glyoxalase superfamily)
MTKATPFRRYNGQAEEAAQFCASVFKDAGTLDTFRSGDEGPVPEGNGINATFRLGGQEIMALGGGRGSLFPRPLVLCRM